MSRFKTWPAIGFILGSCLVAWVLFLTVHARTMLVHSKTQLQQSTAKIDSLEAQLGASLGQYKKTGAMPTTPQCQEVGGVTLTRNYDCFAGFSAAYVADALVSDAGVFNAINGYLVRVNAGYAGYDNSVETYMSEMADTGSWHNIFTIPDSGIPGVMPTQAGKSEDKWRDAISITVDAKRTSPTQATELSISATQEYAACQSFITPCDSFITK